MGATHPHVHVCQEAGAQLADVADAARAGWGSFSQDIFPILRRSIPFETALLVISHTSSAHAIAVEGHDPAFLERRLPAYRDALTADELERMSCKRTHSQSEVFTPSRLERYPLFVEVFRPAGLGDSIARVDGGPRWQVHLGLARTVSGGAFSEREKKALDSLYPTVEVGAVAAVLSSQSSLDPIDEYLRRQGLGRRDAELARLVVQGFSNKEVAALLGISANTVRNLVSALFRCVGVQTRAELAYEAQLESGPDRKRDPLRHKAAVPDTRGR